MDKLSEREDKIFAQRDKIEKEIARTAGVKLTPLQLLRLRQLFSDFERCEKAITHIQETMDELKEVVTA
jgi:DNA-binding GntR family transcriptional regulator